MGKKVLVSFSFKDKLAQWPALSRGHPFKTILISHDIKPLLTAKKIFSFFLILYIICQFYITIKLESIVIDKCNIDGKIILNT